MTSTRLAYRRLAAVIAVLGILNGCAAITGDKTVVTVERVLKVAPSIYDAAITFAEQNKKTLSLPTLKAFEKIRINFPPVYRSLDDALQVYKAAKTKDPTSITSLQAALDDILNQAIALVKANGGPDLGIKFGR